MCLDWLSVKKLFPYFLVLCALKKKNMVVKCFKINQSITHLNFSLCPSSMKHSFFYVLLYKLESTWNILYVTFLMCDIHVKCTSYFYLAYQSLHKFCHIMTDTIFRHRANFQHHHILLPDFPTLLLMSLYHRLTDRLSQSMIFYFCNP